jgi:hypothetical protein
VVQVAAQMARIWRDYWRVHGENTLDLWRVGPRFVTNEHVGQTSSSGQASGARRCDLPVISLCRNCGACAPLGGWDTRPYVGCVIYGSLKFTVI